MEAAGGARIGWSDLPVGVRSAVEAVLGDTVRTAVSQRGGFSPGSADRVVTRRGRRAFVKAVGVGLNPQSVELHRREALVTAGLPASAHAARLLGVHDDGEWVALVLEDVEGRNPVTPWERDDLRRVLQALVDLGQALGPDELYEQLPRTSDDHADDFAGWDRIAADVPAGLDPWALTHLDRLVEAGSLASDLLAGGSLVHGDLRADNILLSADGGVRFVDWPSASIGVGWFDSVSVLVNANLFGGVDVDRLVTHWLSAHDEDVDAVLAGMTGYFLDAARRPPPPGLPTVRAFQAWQGARTLAWLRRRWER